MKGDVPIGLECHDHNICQLSSVDVGCHGRGTPYVKDGQIWAGLITATQIKRVGYVRKYGCLISIRIECFREGAVSPFRHLYLYA